MEANMTIEDIIYPRWICLDCGNKYGRRAGGVCTMHVGKCDVCGEEKSVTEPRDFGYLFDGWRNETKKV
jgi:hypothetical protein